MVEHNHIFASSAHTCSNQNFLLAAGPRHHLIAILVHHPFSAFRAWRPGLLASSVLKYLPRRDRPAVAQHHDGGAESDDRKCLNGLQGTCLYSFWTYSDSSIAARRARRSAEKVQDWSNRFRDIRNPPYQWINITKIYRQSQKMLT